MHIWRFISQSISRIPKESQFPYAKRGPKVDPFTFTEKGTLFTKSNKLGGMMKLLLFQLVLAEHKNGFLEPNLYNNQS